MLFCTAVRVSTCVAAHCSAPATTTVPRAQTLGNKDGARMPFRRKILTAVTAEALAGYTQKVVQISSSCLAQAAAGDTWELTRESR